MASDAAGGGPDEPRPIMECVVPDSDVAVTHLRRIGERRTLCGRVILNPDILHIRRWQEAVQEGRYCWHCRRSLLRHIKETRPAEVSHDQ